MNRYYVRIDGQESPKAYSYEELKELGVLEFDDIQIRKVLENQWYSAKYYNFPEASNTSDYTVDQYGQIVRRGSASDDFTIDEYGQIVRRGSSSNSSGSSGTSSSSGSDEPGCGLILLKLILSAGAVGLCIALGVGSVGIATPVLAYGGYKALEAIWSDWD